MQRWWPMSPPILSCVVVGVACNAIGCAACLALTWLGVPFKLAMSFLYTLGICISFLGSRNWVFEYPGDVAGAVWRFGLAHAACCLFNLDLLVFFVDKLPPLMNGFRPPLFSLWEVSCLSSLDYSYLAITNRKGPRLEDLFGMPYTVRL